MFLRLCCYLSFCWVGKVCGHSLGAFWWFRNPNGLTKRYVLRCPLGITSKRGLHQLSITNSSEVFFCTCTQSSSRAGRCRRMIFDRIFLSLMTVPCNCSGSIPVFCYLLIYDDFLNDFLLFKPKTENQFPSHPTSQILPIYGFWN